MKQTALSLNLSVKKTRKCKFLEQMPQVVPLSSLVELIVTYHPEGRNGKSLFSLETMLRIPFMQQWWRHRPYIDHPKLFVPIQK